jgi:hypothetical protein
MTRSGTLAIWAITLIASCGVLGFSSTRAAGARRRADAATTDLQRATIATDEIRQLRASLPVWTTRGLTDPSASPLADDHPTQAAGGGVDAGGGMGTGTAMSSRVTAALGAAGLPASCMSSVQPDTETTVAQVENMQARRSRVTLTLDGLSLPQLGSFLDAWRRREPAWTVAGIDISPQPPPPPTAKRDTTSSSTASSAWTRGGDAPLHVVLSIEYLYLASIPQPQTGARR